jgi:hypothetical protein
MVLRRFLFETKFGKMFLCFLEQKVGLAVVRADWLAVQRSAEPKTATGTR